ncbi:MAG: DMT family transporter [Anaerolineales bacterium]
MNHPPSRLLPYIALGSGILALSLSAMFVRWAQAPGPVTGFYRLFFSTLLLLFYLSWRKALRPLNGKGWFYPIAGGLFTACDFALWNTAVQYTTASNATLLGNTAPLWVALGAWLIFKEHLNGRFWLGLGLGLFGATLLIGNDFLHHPLPGLGDLLAVGAGVFYAAYLLTTQRGREHFTPLLYIFWVGVVASSGLWGINRILGYSLIGYPQRTWLVFLGTALVSQLIGYLSISYALGHLPARIVSPTLIAQPVLTTFLAIPLLGEIPTALQWLGSAIALIGIYFVHRSHEGER